MDGRDGGKEDKPEPEQNINLRKLVIHIMVEERKRATFSLMMLSERMQRPSNFSIVPDGPNLLKVHLATLGNTEFSGSFLRLGSSSLIARTSLPR